MTQKTLYTPEEDTVNFIYVPKLDLYFTNHEILGGNEWRQSHEELKNSKVHNTKMKMPTIPEFWEFLRHLYYNQENNEEYKALFEDITEVKDCGRGIYLDAVFFKDDHKDISFVDYHVFDYKGRIVPKSESLDPDTLLEDKNPGISLEKILQDPTQLTKQGLPKNKIEDGGLSYMNPSRYNNARAVFDNGPEVVALLCNGGHIGNALSETFGVAQYPNDNAQ